MNVFEKVVDVLENYIGNLKLLCQEFLFFFQDQDKHCCPEKIDQNIPQSI